MKLSLFFRAPEGAALRHSPAFHLGIVALLCLSAFAPVLVLRAPIALAQDAAGAAEPAAYRATIREALSEYRARNFPEARSLFAEAHALYPNARTLRGLGMTSFELRSYRESITYLTQALDSKVKPLDGALRGETERLRARAEHFVGKLNLTVSPADTKVLIDGNPAEYTAGVALVLEVGEHALEFSAEGYHAETRSLHVKGNETETWSVVLPPLPPPAPVAVVPSPEVVAQQAEEPNGPRFVNMAATRTDDKPPLYKNPWLWTGVGAVVLTAIVVGIVVGTHKTEVGKTHVGDNTPPGGVFSALQSQP